MAHLEDNTWNTNSISNACGAAACSTSAAGFSRSASIESVPNLAFANSTPSLSAPARDYSRSVSPKNAPLSPIARRTSRSAFGWRWAPARSSDVAGAAGDVVAHFGSVAIGTPSALWAARYAKAVPFGISTADPPTIAATVVTLIGVAALAGYLRLAASSGWTRWWLCDTSKLSNPQSSEGLPIQLSFSLIARPHSIRKLRVQPSLCSACCRRHMLRTSMRATPGTDRHHRRP